MVSQVDWKVAIVMEQYIRMLHHVGLPKTDMDYIYCDGPVMNELMVKGDCRMCLFTGSQVSRLLWRRRCHLCALSRLDTRWSECVR